MSVPVIHALMVGLVKMKWISTDADVHQDLLELDVKVKSGFHRLDGLALALSFIRALTKQNASPEWREINKATLMRLCLERYNCILPFKK